MRTLIVIIFTLVSSSLFSQSIFGKWKTVDESGKIKSVVEVYEKNGKAYGKVVKAFMENWETKNANCKKCTDDRKDQPIVGMEIIRDLEKDGDEWSDGTILDPQSGKVYDASLWVEDGNLMVRGYIAFFFRTQTWLPYTE